jgi:hypothetical protein
VYHYYALQVKEVATSDVFKSARAIVSDVRQELGTSNVVGIVNDDYVARRANRKRVALRPADPKDMDFDGMSFSARTTRWGCCDELFVGTWTGLSR